MAPKGMRAVGSRGAPVQRPFARRRVLLSRCLKRYYGLIRDSPRLPSTHVLVRWVFAQRPASRASPLYSTCVCQRAAFRTPTDRTAAPGCCFAVRISLRHLCTGSASAFPRTPVLTRSAFRGCKVRFMLRPAGLLALHRQGLLHPRLHLPGSPLKMSDMTTRVNSQFPRPDLHRQHTQHCGLRAEIAEDAEDGIFFSTNQRINESTDQRINGSTVHRVFNGASVSTDQLPSTNRQFQRMHAVPGGRPFLIDPARLPFIR